MGGFRRGGGDVVEVEVVAVGVDVEGGGGGGGRGGEEVEGVKANLGCETVVGG